ncbi:hypothetical protein [Lysobacter gummosus]
MLGSAAKFGRTPSTARMAVDARLRASSRRFPRGGHLALRYR